MRVKTFFVVLFTTFLFFLNKGNIAQNSSEDGGTNSINTMKTRSGRTVPYYLTNKRYRNHFEMLKSPDIRNSLNHKMYPKYEFEHSNYIFYPEANFYYNQLRNQKQEREPKSDYIKYFNAQNMSSIYKFNRQMVANNCINVAKDTLVQAWVRHYASGLVPALDGACAIVADEEGNVFVTGSSSGSINCDDYVTIKYNASGIEEWAERFNGPGNSSDIASAITADESGNVYVTGTSRSQEPPWSCDYTTIKYSTDGTQEWIAQFNGSDNGSDEACAIVVDAIGNVYVTGTSFRTGGSRYHTNLDYATIKYSSSGNQEWVCYYSGLDNYTDIATAIALDEFGNVYVTGSSTDSDTSSTYATIKYSNVGIEEWAALYSGPQKGYNRATSIEVDGSGNIIVTGSSSDSDTSSNYATIKYNQAGIIQWIALYNGPGNIEDEVTALAIDQGNNVYVTGSSHGSGYYSDFATIKYNAEGIEQWVTRYDSPGDFPDDPSSISVDMNGNVYVTGMSGISVGNGCCLGSKYTTVKYNHLGIQEWVVQYSGSDDYMNCATAIAVTSEGDIFVTGWSCGLSSTGIDYATIKYSPSGYEEWVNRYNGKAYSCDNATAMAIDAEGNTYITGQSQSSLCSEYATIKYNSTGTEQWIARYKGPGDAGDFATAIAVDAKGNTYVTGISHSSETGGDYATIRYNQLGIEEWVARYNGPGNYHDWANAITLDASGNVYVTGSSVGSGTKEDYATIKYNPSGKEEWICRYNGPGNGTDYPRSITVDQKGNVYVTGISHSSETYGDYATIKYNHSGGEEWVDRYSSPKSFSDEASAITVDKIGNVYVTGSSYSPDSDDDYTTIKYNSTGDRQWVKSYNGLGNGSDRPVAIVLDNSGNVYVTGSSIGLETNYDYVTIRYSPLGQQEWIAQYNGPFNNNDFAKDICIDTLGCVYVTGQSKGSEIYFDYATIKYSSSGREVWVSRYNGFENSSAKATAIDIDNSGSVFVAGSSVGSIWSYYSTIKYENVPASLENLKNRLIAGFSLSQNYPNPFNPKTVISYQLALSSEIDLSIYNILGQKVATLVSEKQNAGSYSVEWDGSSFASGVYLYQLTTDQGFTQTKKLVLLK